MNGDLCCLCQVAGQWKLQKLLSGTWLQVLFVGVIISGCSRERLSDQDPDAITRHGLKFWRDNVCTIYQDNLDDPTRYRNTDEVLDAWLKLGIIDDYSKGVMEKDGFGNKFVWELEVGNDAAVIRVVSYGKAGQRGENADVGVEFRIPHAIQSKIIVKSF